MDLDPSEEPEQIMNSQDQSELGIQEMDTNEGVGSQQDPMNALVIVTSPDTQVTPPPKGSTNAPRWLEAAIGKKRSVVPITIPLEDMVNKCLGKALKPKKLKIQAMLDVDDTTGHWTVDVAKPILGRDADKATKEDFTMEKIDLGVASRAVDVKHLESSTKRTISRTWKDEKDKREMKQMVAQMIEYINVVHNPNPRPLSQIPVSFDPKSLANQKMLDQVQRNRVMTKMFNK